MQCKSVSTTRSGSKLVPYLAGWEMGKDYSFTLREVSKRPVARSDHVLALRIFLIIICIDIVSALSIELLPAVRVSE